MSNNTPTFQRNISKEPPAFKAGYAGEMTHLGGASFEQLDVRLTELTVECKELRQKTDPSDPARQRLEGRRCAVHDRYFGMLFGEILTEEQLTVEFRRLKRQPSKGIRWAIAVWAMNRRGLSLEDAPVKVPGDASTSSTTNGSNGRKKKRQQSTRRSHGTRQH